MDGYPEATAPSAHFEVLHGRQATAFLVTVHLWMFLGLALTSVAAWMVVSSTSVIMYLIAHRGVFLGLLVAELLLVMALNPIARRLPAIWATSVFLLYSALNGVTLSMITLVYARESIVMAFLSAACLFGTMSLYGYVTKRDLTSLGSMLTVGLIALIICMVLNFFLRSPGFSYAISLVGVVVFLGLTAHDTQKILRLGREFSDIHTDGARKAAILGALELYLDFINLFLFMLRIFGKRK